MYAFSYKISGGSVKLNWKIQDFVRDCPVDVAAEFIGNSLQITDLDKDGIAEVWMVYKLVCHSDVSPSDMKIIMYEGNKKFAMRGENKVQTGVDDKGKPYYSGGTYKMDENFKKGPGVFRIYAERLWGENVLKS